MGYVADIFNEQALAELPGTVRHRPRPVLDGGREQAGQRAADPDRLRARRRSPSATTATWSTQRELRDELVAQGSIFQTSSDTEVFLHLYARSKASARRRRARRVGRRRRRAPSRWLFLTQGPPGRGARPARLPAAGPRPAGRRLGGVLGDLRAGPHRRHLRARRRAGRGARSSGPTARGRSSRSRRAPLAHCIFEHVYFARPDSYVFGESVNEVRTNLGRLLAREAAGRRRRRRAGARLRASARRSGTPRSRASRCSSGSSATTTWADLHRAAAVDPPLRREGEAEPGAQHPRRAARRARRRLDRARHDQPQDRAR